VHSYYEIVGKVINLEGGQGLGLRVLGVTDIPLGAKGQGPDLKLFAAVVECVFIYFPQPFQAALIGDSATLKYKDMFYADDGGQSNGDYSAY